MAAALEASGKGGAVVAEIAHHRLAALPHGDPAAAAAAARAAADRAMTMLAFEDAATLLQQARRAVESTPAPDRRDLCELELLEGTAWMRAGDATRGRAACGAAADEARRLGAGDLLARAALGYGAELMLGQTNAGLLALLEEALAMLPPGPGSWRAQVLARLAAALQPAADVNQPMALAREAIAMARPIGDPTMLRTVLLSCGAALADYAPPAERAAVSEELVTLAAAAGDRFQLMRGQARLVFDYLELGAVARSARALESHELVAAEFRQARHLWPGRLMRSMLASAQGHFDEAQTLFDEAVPLAERDDESSRRRSCSPAAGWGTPWRANGSPSWPPASSRRSRCRACPASPPGRGASPTCCSPPGPPASATRTPPASTWRGWTSRIRRCSPAGCRTRSWPRWSPSSTTGDWPPSVTTSCVPLAGRMITYGRSGMSCAGAADTALGMLAAVLGRLDEADRHFQAAEALLQAGGLRPYLAQSRYWHARLLRTRAAPGDEARARALAAQARAMAEALGLPMLAAPAGAAGRRDVRAPRRPHRPCPPPRRFRSSARGSTGPSPPPAPSAG